MRDPHLDHVLANVWEDCSSTNAVRLIFSFWPAGLALPLPLETVPFEISRILSGIRLAIIDGRTRLSP